MNTLRLSQSSFKSPTWTTLAFSSAAAGFVVARDDPELHAVAVHLTESRRKAFQYLRGTRLRRIALQYAAKQYGNETMKNEKFSSPHSVSSRNFQFLIFNS